MRPRSDSTRATTVATGVAILVLVAGLWTRSLVVAAGAMTTTVGAYVMAMAAGPTEVEHRIGRWIVAVGGTLSVLGILLR
jgi:hypothetical protein